MWTKTAKDWHGKDIVGEHMNKFLLTEINNTIMGFLINDGKVNEIRCYEEESILGNIYVGRVSNIVKNINAAFVDIKKGLSCYMPLEDYTGDKLKIGDLLTVQINKEPIKTKQPSVTTKLSLTGEYVVVHQDDVVGVSNKIKDNTKRESLKNIFNKAIDTLKSEKAIDDISFGGIVRTNAEIASEDEAYNETIKLLCQLDNIIKKSTYATVYSCMYEKIPAYVQDIDYFSKYMQDSEDKIEVITDLEDIISKCQEYSLSVPKLYDDTIISMKAMYSLDSIIDKALGRKVFLKSGAYLVIEPTEAMTVIDVNSGKAIKGNSKEDKLLDINIEAAREIARQLKLRNISGIIIVDFINMEEAKNNELIMKELRDAVSFDTVLVSVVDMTKLGLVEITRKRIRKPLHEIIKK